MLKLTYTENGFYLEQLTVSLENWVTARMLLALRSATSIMIEPSTASFLLPANLPQWSELERLAISTEGYANTITLARCDNECREVCLQGTWVVSEPESEEGIFIAHLSDGLEHFLYQLWREAERLTLPTGD
ncbi:alr0857 family protein [Spirulina subsalsa]|uniref:alr0857 family protein n=1 Tax=Spirulina subsalsa TaxID=54311 RepID=UPI0002E2E030|nr:alr0857 family protein [Spirulina subsalsa]